MKSAIVDSGFLVALGIASDPRHCSAKAFVARYRGTLLVPAPVIVESSYFLSTAGKVSLLDWLAVRCKILDVPVGAYPEIGAILAKYSTLDPDFTDAAIVWLATEHDCSAVLTADDRDFETFRIRANKRFVLVDWQSAG